MVHERTPHDLAVELLAVHLGGLVVHVGEEIRWDRGRVGRGRVRRRERLEGPVADADQAPLDAPVALLSPARISTSIAPSRSPSLWRRSASTIA